MTHHDVRAKLRTQPMAIAVAVSMLPGAGAGNKKNDAGARTGPVSITPGGFTWATLVRQ